MLDKVIEKYILLTGKKITEAQKPQYEAWALRAIRELEVKLGWPIEGRSNVTVKGCTKGSCDCDIDESQLEEAPEKVGEYRFFNFNSKTPFVQTDPFKKVHAVYLCRVEPEGRNIHSKEGEVIILTKVTDFAPKYFNGQFGKYIKACEKMTICQEVCNSNCTNCSAVLVDADWLTFDDLPDELLYLLFDYMDWMANGGVSSRGIRSESVDGHSVSYGSDWQLFEPYTNPTDAAIILAYSGPFGMVDRKLIW